MCSMKRKIPHNLIYEAANDIVEVIHSKRFQFFFLFLSFPFFDIYFAFIVARLTIEQTEFYIFFPRCIGILSACWQNSNLTNNLIILKKRENKTIFFSQTTHSKQTVLNFHLALFNRRENVQTIRLCKDTLFFWLFTENWLFRFAVSIAAGKTSRFDFDLNCFRQRKRCCCCSWASAKNA